MAVDHIHTYLVHPGKGVQPPAFRGTTVALDGSKLFKLLDNIYSKSDSECDIDIAFNHNSAGQQQNDCRDLTAIMHHAGHFLHGWPTAARQQSVRLDRCRSLALRHV